VLKGDGAPGPGTTPSMQQRHMLLFYDYSLSQPRKAFKHLSFYTREQRPKKKSFPRSVSTLLYSMCVKKRLSIILSSITRTWLFVVETGDLTYQHVKVEVKIDIRFTSVTMHSRTFETNFGHVNVARNERQDLPPWRTYKLTGIQCQCSKMLQRDKPYSTVNGKDSVMVNSHSRNFVHPAKPHRFDGQTRTP
jgi:hypothetical protein